MKFVFALILFVGLGTLIEGTEKDYTDEDTEAFRNFVARSVFNIVANKLRNFHGPIQQDPSAKATIVPPIDDPLSAEPLNICGMDITIPTLNISIQGDLNVMDPVVTGLSRFYNDLKIQYIAVSSALTIDIDIQLPEVTLLSPFMAELKVRDGSPGSIDLTGNGELPCGASNVFLKFHGKGKLPTLAPNLPLSLDELDVDLGFKNLKFDPSGLTSGGSQANLSHLAGQVQGLFDSLWTDTNKIAVNEIVRCLIDDLVSDCSLSTLLVNDTINLGCLKDTINLECLPSEESVFKPQYFFQTPVCEGLVTAPTEEPTVSQPAPTSTSENPLTSTTESPNPGHCHCHCHCATCNI